MSGTRWVRVTSIDNIPVREGRPALVGDLEIAIFNMANGRFLAAENLCPHKGGPICDGIVTGVSVVCPLHQWKCNLETGGVERPANQDACLKIYPLRVEDGVISIEVPAAATNEEFAA
jgi:nitrite reductase (NADH) small subunit